MSSISICPSNAQVTVVSGDSLAEHRGFPEAEAVHSPRGSAALAGLAEQEAHLLQGLCESVFGRHFGRLIRQLGAGRVFWVGRSVAGEREAGS